MVLSSVALILLEGEQLVACSERPPPGHRPKQTTHSIQAGGVGLSLEHTEDHTHPIIGTRSLQAPARRCLKVSD